MMSGAQFEHRSCPACGSDKPVAEVRSDPPAEAMTLTALQPYWSGLFKEKVFFSYDRCGKCGLLFAPTFFTQEQLGTLYASMAPNMEDVSTAAIEATQKGYFDVAIEGAELTGHYLEIGPDLGYIVRHAADRGDFGHFWLFEPNRDVHGQLSAAAGGRPHDISASMGDLSEVPDGSVGLAVMVHVLDHLLDPMAMLAEIRRKLRPGGRLMIVTHNEGSLLRKLMGKKWPPFCLQHPELYNPDSMTALIKRAGYGTVRVQRSKNYFPLDFLARQAAWAAGMKLKRVPLPRASIGLKLGNMITVAGA